jgi:hypothetical protein
MRLSETLEVPLAHFVSRPPAAVTSRRRDLDDDADTVSRGGSGSTPRSKRTHATRNGWWSRICCRSQR